MGSILKKTHLIQKAMRIFIIAAELEQMAEECSASEKSLAIVYRDCSSDLHNKALEMLIRAARIED